MRVVIGEGILDFPTPSIKNPEDSFDFVESLIQKWQGDGLVGVLLLLMPLCSL